MNKFIRITDHYDRIIYINVARIEYYNAETKGINLVGINGDNSTRIFVHDDCVSAVETFLENISEPLG